MKLPVLLGLVVALSGCREEDGECPRARNGAKAAVAAAEYSVNEALDDAKAHATQMRLSYEEVKDGAAKLENRLSLLEMVMACRHSARCCDDFGSLSARNKAMVYSTAMNVWEVMIPIEVADVVNPLKETLNEADRLGTMTAKEARTWCTATLAGIERVRRDAPSAWTSALFVASKEVDAANEQVLLAGRRVKALGGWSHAVQMRSTATIAPDLDLGPVDFGRAKDAVELYANACDAHGSRIARK